jgi:Bacterial pre-peptidase C-terminal domain
MSPRRRTRRVALALFVSLALVSTAHAQSAPPTPERLPDPNYVQLLRRAKQDQIMNEPARERQEALERREARARRERAAKRAASSHAAHPTVTGARLRPPRFPEDAPARSTLVREPLRSLGATASFPPANVRVNDPAADSANVGQAEESLAADGQNVLCAFNDGQGFVTGGGNQGYAYSTDGGNTFTDGGAPPAPAGWTWNSDPLVTVDEKTHTFYFCALADSNLADPAHAWNGIATVRATFPSPGAPTWGTPMIAIKSTSSAVVFDKEWMTADSTTHALYLVYVRFNAIGDDIYFQRSLNQGVTWTNAVQLSGASESGLVQGPRVIAGPAPTAPVYVAWYSIGTIDVDAYKVRKSTNGGLSFGAILTAASAYHAFENGAPGFNRGVAVDFPSLAVDASAGVHRGRVYLAWQESVNYYGDTLYFSQHTGAGNRNEVEPNDTPPQATPFTLGQTLRGTLSDGDQDWFSFAGTQGQTVYILVDSLDVSINDALRLIASDGSTRLTLSAPGAGVGYGGQIVFTLPVTGTYYLRPAAPPGTFSSGGYRVRTALHHAVAGRSRDHRDIFVASSDDGVSWNSPVMVNDDPPYFDDWLPEVAVDGNGVVYAEWYDWRDSPPSTCGGVSNTYLSRSANGGAVFTSFGAITDVQTAWTSVASNIAPNQGDYLGLFANGNGVYPAWADGRNGNPDVYAVPLGLPYLLTPVEASLVRADADANGVSLMWYEGGTRAEARIERRAQGEWQTLATVGPDGSGYVIYHDTSVAPGDTYDYRLAIPWAGGTRYVGDVSVSVPRISSFALERPSPNPTSGAPRVAFSLASFAPASLTLTDIAGRRVRTREVGALGPGRHVIDLAPGDALPAGIYLVSLRQGRESRTERVAILH